MALLNPVVSKFTLTAGVPHEVYMCPANKSHALVNLSFFKDNLSGTSLIAVALSSESNPANLTTVDYFVDDIELIDTVNVAELDKIIVGKGERLYVKVLSGSNINVRLSGIEENNPKILKAGRLAATNIPNTARTQIYSNNLSNVSYISTSVTIFNTSPTNNNQVECWVSTSNTPSATDKVLNIRIPPQDTTILENLLISPNEKIFVRANQSNTEFFINGFVVSA